MGDREWRDAGQKDFENLRVEVAQLTVQMKLTAMANQEAFRGIHVLSERGAHSRCRCRRRRSTHFPVPATLTIPSGQTSGSFTVTAQ